VSVERGDSPVTGIDHIGVRVPDLDQALSFFVDILGAEKTADGVGVDGVSRVVFVRLGATDIELFALDGSAAAALDHVALCVEGEVRDALALMGRQGVRSLGGEVQASRGERMVSIDPATSLGLSTMLHGAPKRA
jgi:catechol 2,3-dioxygenase-like lactoylglutathione lyase family enzyme